ncbi:MAG: hypothetical protein KAR35_04845, partial [Candidatus Heimdallarchaeota archaeon]|nr:hypothetical protein [Candidatus Heimdallarchaeota archaeon]MCK5048683.1 hypothetical protein [Candidatus Heimdallarchaeota archaeon]
FWSKDAILLTAWESPLEVGKFLFYVAAFTALLTAFYSARMVFLVFFTKPRYGKKAHPHEVHWVMWAPLVALGSFVVLETLLFQPFFGFEGWLHTVLHHGFDNIGAAHELNWGIAVGSMGISLLGIGGAYVFYQWKGLILEDIRDVKIIGPIASGTTKFFENRWYVDAIIYKLTDWFVKYVGGAANWFDTQILDEKMYSNVIPKGTLSVAGFTTFKVERGIDLTLDQIAEKTNNSGKWLRRIQSGITQDYMGLIVTTLAIFLSYISLQKFGII